VYTRSQSHDEMAVDVRSHCYFIGTTLADNPVPHHFLALANELVKRGHQVVILAPHRRVDLEDHSANPAIYTWPSERPTRTKDLLFFYRLIRKYQPACLIANFSAVNIMMLAGWLAQVPVRVAWYHTISGQLAQDDVTPKWKQQLLRLRKRVVYRSATHVVANSAASARDVRAMYGVLSTKCNVLFNSLADPNQIVRLKNFSPEEGRFVCVGRLFPSKGQDVLIHALAILKNQTTSFHVDFVGEGPSLGDLQQLACSLGVEEQCTFLGRISHPKVLKRMGVAVATIVPSRNEAFGLVNIESMAVGTPVIASKVGGIVEIVRDGVDGFLVPAEDPKALAEKLNLFIKNPELRKEMSLNARQRFLKSFEQQQLIRQQADWMESAVTGEAGTAAMNLRNGTLS
jgi:glycosyltransferase involved in cell wall biosynthesis